MPVSYPPPLDRLLTLGEPDVDDWLDYAAFGIGPELVPELIRMTTDDALYDAGQETPEGWAYVHAWRALVQLHATEAVAPLMSLFARRRQDGWVSEELPDALGRMGPAALPAMSAFLQDPKQLPMDRGLVVGAVGSLVKHCPVARAAAIETLAGQLAHFADQDSELNAFLVGELVNLKALESLPVIEAAFSAHAVPRWIAGDLNDVRRQLGLEPATPPPPPARPLRMKGVEPEGEAPAPKQKPAPAPPRPAQQAARPAPPAQQTANQRAKMLRKQAGGRRKRKK